MAGEFSPPVRFGSESPYVQAMKDGNVYIFDVIVLKHGNSSHKVSKRGQRLEQIRVQSKDNALHTEDNIHTMFAIKKRNNDIWYCAPSDEYKVSYNDQFKPLRDEIEW